MTSVIDLLQSFRGDMGIDLSGGEGGMTQEFLDSPQVSSPPYQMACKGMTEEMRR